MAGCQLNVVPIVLDDVRVRSPDFTLHDWSPGEQEIGAEVVRGVGRRVDEYVGDLSQGGVSLGAPLSVRAI